jgi:hypothetical protein
MAKLAFHRALAVFGACALVATLAVVHTAAAQSDSGTVTGRVLWGACIRAIPLPAPNADQPAASPDAAQNGSRPIPPVAPSTGLPAGAVLVAVQNTSVNARTDETGRFTLNGVPAGQYLTVAAGPVADSLSAVAARPNVFVTGGQSMDIGTLSLGGMPSGTLPCRVPPIAIPQGAGAATTPDDTAP